MKILKFLMFNFLTRQAFKKRGIEGILNERLQSISIDFSYIMSLVAPLIIIVMITIFFDIFEKQDVGLNKMNNVSYLVMTVITFFILNKDIFKGQSVGKRIHGFKVVDNLTNESPSDFKLMIRNITMAIWPIDVVFALINPNRRLGDFIAGTKVIKCDNLEPETILIDIKEKKFDGNSIITLLISLIIAWSMFVITNPMTWMKNL